MTTTLDKSRTAAEKPPEPPSSLGRRGAAEWRTVLATFDLDATHLALLRAACEQLDRADQARLVIKKSGVTFSDRFGQLRDNPACMIERNALNAYRLLRRELCLDESEVQEFRAPRRPGGK